MRIEITLKFIESTPIKKELVKINVEKLSRIPNIGEKFHYVSGFDYNFLTAGKVVNIETILHPFSREIIEITIDTSLFFS